MSLPKALIVDDSKTAQLRLEKLLKSYEMQVDVAFSAEEAFGYLETNRPVVIFLDHDMEGMDGLEALRVIKANPDTAMIPVIMYTAQQGDFYAGQAHALGALDILSKEIMKPSTLERALNSLRIVPGEPVPERKPGPLTREDAAERRTSSASASGSVSNSEEFKSLRAHLTGLLELHSVETRGQIRELAKKLTERPTNKNEPQPNSDDVDNDELTTDENDRPFASSMGLFIGGFCLVAVAFLGYLTYEVKQLSNRIANTSTVSKLQTEELQADVMMMAESLYDLSEEQFKPHKSNEILLSAISWALDADTQFDFNEEPLKSSTVDKIDTLIEALDDANFRGLVDITVHYGNTCLQRTDTGTWKLAAPKAKLEQCEFYQNLDIKPEPKQLLSSAYLRFEQRSAPVIDERIQVRVGISNSDIPRLDYPQVDTVITAAEWNAVALKNNRVSLRLLPQEEATPNP